MSELPEGWLQKPLVSLLSQLISGQSPNRKENPASGNTWGILKTTAVDWGRFDCSKNQEVLDDFEVNESIRVKTGDILITKAGPFNRVGVVAVAKKVHSKVLVSGKISLLRNKEGVSESYLGYALCLPSSQRHLKDNTTGMAMSQTNFTHDTLKTTPILLPPLKEQTKIAEILTSVDNVIELTEKEIEKLQMLKKGMMQDLLTKGIGHTTFKESPLGRIPDSWELTKLEKVISTIGAGWSPDCLTYPATGLEWGVLRTTSVTWNGFNSYENKKLPPGLKHRESIVCHIGDVLITRAGPVERTAVVAYVDEVKSNLMLSDKIIRIRGKENIVDNYFLSKVLSSDYCQYYFDLRKTGLASSQANISQDILKESPIVLPPIDEQLKISKFLIRLESQIDAKIKYYNRLFAIRKALMSDLLTGKVRVKV